LPCQSFFVKYWLVIFGSLFGGTTSSSSRGDGPEKMQKAMDRLLLRVPVFGALVNKSAVARWDSHTGNDGSRPAFRWSRRSTPWAVRRAMRFFAEATEQTRRTSPLAGALTTSMQTTGVFPVMVLQNGGDRRGVRLARHMLGKGGRVLRGRGRRDGERACPA
jgi:type IV pilus assembly protein PilC